jgi:hypothetical protein
MYQKKSRQLAGFLLSSAAGFARFCNGRNFGNGFLLILIEGHLVVRRIIGEFPLYVIWFIWISNRLGAGQRI